MPARRPRSAGNFPDAPPDDAQHEVYRQRVDVFLASREAGTSLTYEALRAGIRLEPIIDLAAETAAYVDEAQAIIKEEYRPALHCRANCDYCCRKPGVLITIPELLRIISQVGDTFSPDAVERVRVRARRYATQMEGRNVNTPTNESVPCPLLVDGRCSVYDVRPLVCRGYNSTSVDACRQAHADSGRLVPIFAFLKDVTDGTTVGIAQALRTAGFNDSLVDLGTALHIALEAGDRFPDAVVGGSAALRPAENSTWVRRLWAEVRKAARRCS